jgi:hypothetical protein
MTACPVCAGRTRDGLMCTACWRQLERDLRAIPDLITDLDTAAAKQARLTAPEPGGLASEQTPVGWDAAETSAHLVDVLIHWANTVTGQPHYYGATARARLLKSEAAIRAHPAAGQLCTQIAGAVHRARKELDRKDRHIDIGDCPDCGGTLRAHLPAADDRPTSINCLGNPAHTWTPDQWLRLGRRILHAKGPTP